MTNLIRVCEVKFPNVTNASAFSVIASLLCMRNIYMSKLLQLLWIGDRELRL